MTTSNAAKKPQDHKSGENFTFEHDGKTYQFERSLSILSKPGFLRKNRKLEPLDLLFTMLEEIAGDEALEAIDDMDTEEFADFYKSVEEATQAMTGATLGES